MEKRTRPRPGSKAKRELPELAQTLDAIEAYLRRFVVFPSDVPDGLDGSLGEQPMTIGDAQAGTVALWAAHAHAVDAFHVTPRLLFTSAEPESGKTTALDVLAQLVPEPLLTGNVTAPALYRSIDAGLAQTILCDELDAIYTGAKSDRNEDLRTFINSGYKRGAQTIRCVGKSQTPQQFSTFAPVALAGLDNGFLPETITTRSINVRMKAKKAGEHVEDFIAADFEHEASELRERLSEVLSADASLHLLRGITPTGLEGLHNRKLEIARPLQVVAQAAGREWADRSRAALRFLLSKTRGESITVRLLRDLHRLFNEARMDRLFTSDILDALNADEAAPWCRWRVGREQPQLNPTDLARLLSKHEVFPKTIWKDGTSAKGYERAQLIDPWERHVTPFIDSSPREPSEASGRQDANGHDPGEAARRQAAERFMKRAKERA